MLCVTAICVIMTRLTVCASETAQTEVRIIVEDTEDISDAEENSTDNSAEKAGSGTDLNSCTLRLTIETRDHKHVMEIKEAVKKAGYDIIAELS